MREHHKYNMLCALAAAGDISNDDLEDLRNHVIECNDCRILVSDFIQVSAQVLPLHGAVTGTSIPSGMRARFVERARREGIPLHRPRTLIAQLSRILRPQWPRALAIPIGLVILLAVLKIGNLRRGPFSQSSPAPAAVSSDTARVAVSSSNQDFISRLQQELKQEREGARNQAATIAYLERDRESLKLQKEELAARVSSLESEAAGLRQVSEQRASVLSDTNKQLDSKRVMEADQLAMLAERQIAVEDLRAKLFERDAELRRSRELLAASNQARDLIIARNLHIVDVHDSNAVGEHQRPFGRIFFTEGKSLVFYAYDLQESGKVDGKVSFHVWGTKLGDQQQVKSLGVFQTEDAGARRWVLTCDDPGMLAQVNTVFVTTESTQKKIDQPNGKRILYAFLDGRPNHP